PGWDLSEEDRWRGVAVAGDGNSRYGRISPYLQGVNAAVESMRNVASVGAKPRAITDCLNYGNPEIPEQLWQLEEGVRGIADAAREVTIDGECVPVVSGNVSLYNGRPDGSAIDPTAIVCCVGVFEDARRGVTMQLKSPNSQLFLVGARLDECGGSAYYEVLEQMSSTKRDALLGCNAPNPDFSEVSNQIKFVTEAIDKGFISSCHDISNGGLLLALFEMMLPQRRNGGSVGVDVSLNELGDLRSDTLLFSETGGFIIEVSKQEAEALEKLANKSDIELLALGQTLPSPELVIKHHENAVFSESLEDLQKIWNNGMESAF
ncbi:MAG: phosphoribosylformylglycinamidine synthase, partial [Deltaproteobacteria bacterium]|nr:phosphoribosylformylglycinamidine synthase [Deltaproteobacteria bacterium]